jgi:protein TonB
VAPPPAAPQAPSAPPVAALSRPADAAPSPGPAEAVDTGTLDRFRMEILAATRRYRRYPAQAIEKGWQGKVEIRLVIGANGMTQSYAIKSSSGFQLLDDTAMDMVKKGRPLVQVPASLRGREFTVDVPVIFDLKSG